MAFIFKDTDEIIFKFKRYYNFDYNLYYRKKKLSLLEKILSFFDKDKGWIKLEYYQSYFNNWAGQTFTFKDIHQAIEKLEWFKSNFKTYDEFFEKMIQKDMDQYMSDRERKIKITQEAYKIPNTIE